MTVSPQQEGRRLDQVLAEHLPQLRRSQIKQRLSDLQCNDKPAKLATRAVSGDHLTAIIDDPPKTDLRGEDIPLSIVREAADFVVIDKPQGMVVHPGAGNWSGTLVHALIGRYGDSPAGEPERPGIVHRLDKETSGVLIVARSEERHAWLVDQFSGRRVEKHYLAIVKGCPPLTRGRIAGALGRDPHHRTRYSVHGAFSVHNLADDSPPVPEIRDLSAPPAGARSALTEVRVLRCFGMHYALVDLQPLTGRTHQLRVHMQQWGHPVLGDPLYSRRDPRFPSATLMLHARTLTLRTAAGREPERFTAPPPERVRTVLRVLARADYSSW